MPADATQPVSRREALRLVAVLALLVALAQWLAPPTPVPARDALRYADYALNLAEHGVFGVSGTGRDAPPSPGFANSPLYPTALAALVAADRRLATSLRCAVVNRGGDSGHCPRAYASVVLAQSAVVIAALVCVWLAVRRALRSPAVAWLSVLLVLASTKPTFYANRLLTEVAVLALVAALLLALVLALERPGRAWRWFAVGTVVAGLALTRPEYLYLAYAGIGAGLLALLSSARRQALPALGAFALAVAVLTAPWLARNHHHFGQATLTGGYGDVIIAARSAYNRMSGAEWLAAFVYWLPGHGEALARALLPAASYAKLGTQPDSYLRRDAREIFDAGLRAVDGDRARLAGHLLRTEVLAQPLRHAWTSMPLAWRGVLTGKYLAVAGLPCVAWLAIHALRRRRWRLLALGAPALFMVALYAGASISIPRYNVFLIYYYAAAVAWVSVRLTARWLPRPRGPAAD